MESSWRANKLILQHSLQDLILWTVLGTIAIFLSFRIIEKEKYSKHCSSSPFEYKSHRVTVRVFGFNRPESLARLFQSLNNMKHPSQYRRIDFYVYLDTPTNIQRRKELNNVLAVRNITKEFPWHLGRKGIYYRLVHHGLHRQWMAAWYPMEENEATVFLEDDNEVSPQYLEYITKLNHFKYFTTTLTKYTRNISIAIESEWYLTVTINDLYKPYIDNDDATYNQWIRQEKDVWSPWLRKFLEEYPYWFVYCDTPKHSTVWIRNHREIGVNTRSFDKTPLSELFKDDLSDYQIPSLKYLPVLECDAEGVCT
eukprot:jgi/Galph1/3277/GphlegSOOS_G1942.1